MVREFEEKHDSLVFHVIKTMFVELGVMYALLYVSDSVEEWAMDMNGLNYGEAIAYVVNVADPDCSEFGMIGVEPMNGGLHRTW